MPGQQEDAAAGGGGGARRRRLTDRERLIHAPMSDVGGLLFDKDAVYIDLPDWKVRHQQHTHA